MPYQLKELTIRTNNTNNGLESIAALWADVSSGKLPLLFDSAMTFQEGISPVSKYSNYESDETGDYDLSILGVTADFFQEMADKVKKGSYHKYEHRDANGDLAVSTQKAWAQVWADQAAGTVMRAFTVDYESTVPPAYTKDGQAHCYLYIAVK